MREDLRETHLVGFCSASSLLISAAFIQHCKKIVRHACYDAHYLLSDKSKPVVMQGRKVMDLSSETAGLPKRVSEVVFDTHLLLSEMGAFVFGCIKRFANSKSLVSYVNFLFFKGHD